MKPALIIALCATAGSHAITLDRRQAPGTAPKPSGKGAPKGLPVGMSSPEFGSLIGSAMSLINSISKSLTQAKSDLQKGKPFGQVFDETLPKIVEQAKLHTRAETDKENLLRSDSKKMRATFGPYRLVGKNQKRPAAELLSLDPRGQGKITFLPKGNLCGNKDCTILLARIGLTYKDGSPATPETGVYVHHILSFVPTRPSINAIGICDVPDASKDIGKVNKAVARWIPFSPFTGRGEDGGPVSMMFTSIGGKYNSGFHLGKNDIIMVQSDLVNYANQSQDVYLTYDYEYVDGFQGRQAITTMLSVTGCLLVIPPKINMTGRAVTTSRQYPVTEDATLLNLRGHMHDGGESMVIKVNNKTICTSFPEYKGTELWSMTSCTSPYDVKKGDYITLEAAYDVTKHPMRSGVMNQHSHAQNVFGLNDLMGLYAVTFSPKANASALQNSPAPPQAVVAPKSAA